MVTTRQRRCGTAAGLVLLLALTALPAAAAMVCSASVNRTTVPVGGDLLLTATAEGDVGWSVDFRLPDLPGVRISNGGTNQSMSMVNGQTRTSVTRTWYLSTDQTGTLDIGPITVTAQGQTCRTEPLRVTVIPASSAVPPADTGNRTAPQANLPAEPGARAGDIFVTLTVDKPEAWLGEQIILTFRYWWRVQPWNNPSYTPPRTEGFWREDLGPERNLREVKGGRAYSVTEIRYALFPTRAGDLVIEPAELAFPEDVFDRFFNSRRRSQGPKILRTERVTVHVKPLPEPAPPAFTGLVANDLQLTARVSPDSVGAGEPIDLKLQLNADGFLKGFKGLDVAAPPDARMHDAAESFDTGLRGDRLRGSLNVEKVLVPEHGGTLEIPPTNLTWFDADRGRYVTTSTPLRRVAVGGGALPAGEEIGSGFLRSEISRLGEDLAFIHAPPRSLARAGSPFAGSAPWWILLGAPLVLLGLWRTLLARLEAERRDPAGRRRRRALKEARAALAAAGGDPAAVARAVRAYVADCTDRPVASVDAGTVAAFCADRGRPEAGDRLQALLTACDAARFGGADADPEALAADARRQLEALESAAGRTRPAPGAATAIMLACVLAAATLAGPSAAQSPDPVRLLAEGNQAYTQGDLDRALELYREARAQGVDDATLEYNLGNTHARRGELGLAVASYLRAQRLDPRDGDIRANLARVRGQIRDLSLAGGQLPVFIRQFAALAGRLTVDEWAIAFLVLVWSLATLVAWGWYREEFSDNLRRVGLALAALLVVTGGVAGWRWYGERMVDTGVVVAEESAVRSGPADTFPALFMVHDGLAVRLEESRGDWVRVSLGGDWRGWLPRTDLVRVRDEEAATAAPAVADAPAGADGSAAPQGR